jgi:hypothetical protein
LLNYFHFYIKGTIKRKFNIFEEKDEKIDTLNEEIKKIDFY